ncbi:glycine cleavage system protein H [Erysipelothrix larvae]|uniref:Glycine cleavage system H protein n=1 Tax=Erysipelothrix larvae TaxID=1514105 RepID=A0A109UHK3_9FIRM|nr:glycine cleavage system protein GcvH [Erysipelothrix larvae]AMC94338.1 glycine cleavage system protein H [Erysipelothrix larvae]
MGQTVKYTKTHEWVELLEDDSAKIGITDFAQGELGDIVYIELPEVGHVITRGKGICDIESVKAVSEIFAPVSGTIVEVNEALADTPELINEKPMEAWIVRVEGISDTDELLTEEAYKAL